MNDVEIWQNGHKGLKEESCYRVGYGEVNEQIIIVENFQWSEC